MKSDSTYLKKIASDNPYLNDLVPPEPVDPTKEVQIDPSGFQPMEISEWVGWVVLAVIVLIIIVILVKWYINRDKPIQNKESQMGEDTIFGHDWDTEEISLRDSNEYGKLAVLLYLKHLNQLHEDQIIEFHVSKTPGMFTRDIEDYFGRASVDPKYRDSMMLRHHKLTETYLNVRYGHRDTNAGEIEHLKTL